MDYSTRNSIGIIKNLEVQIGNALVQVDFHVLENKQNMSPSLLLGRAFVATVGTVSNMQTNQLGIPLINSGIYYDPVIIVKSQTSNTGVDSGFIATGYCEFEVEYETEYEAEIDSSTPPSIENDIPPTINTYSKESIDTSPANESFALPAHCYPSFDVATQLQTSTDYYYGDTISDYSIGSWADDSLHESFAVHTELLEMQSDENDEDNHREKTIEYCGLEMDD